MPSPILVQSFTGTAGVDLTTLAPATGSGAWSRVGSTTGRILADGTGGVYTPDNQATYINATSIPANATITFAFTCLSEVIGGPGITFCQDSATDSCYNLRLYSNGAGIVQFGFYLFSNGSPTVLATVGANGLPVAGDTFTLTIPPRDGSNNWAITLSKNGGAAAALFSGTVGDTTRTGVGPIGWRTAGANTATTGYHATNLTVTIPGVGSYTLLGPTSGVENTACTFTVQTVGGAPSTALVVTPASTLAGTFAPTTVTISDALAHAFTFTPAALGAGTVSVTHTGGGFTGDPAALAFTSTIPPTPVDLTANRIVRCDFGSSYAGLTTVGITRLSPNTDGSASVTTARTTVGVGNRTGGIYTAAIPLSFVGLIEWDTGGTTPAYLWDAINTSTATGGSSGSTVDPWTVALPGTYAAGTAGQILGHNLDAQVSTRSIFAGGQVASVANQSGVILGASTVGATPSPTVSTFSAPLATLNATAGAYIGQSVLFQSGSLATERRVITTYAVAAGVATFGVASPFTAAPVTGDSFVVV